MLWVFASMHSRSFLWTSQLLHWESKCPIHGLLSFFQRSNSTSDVCPLNRLLAGWPNSSIVSELPCTKDQLVQRSFCGCRNVSGCHWSNSVFHNSWANLVMVNQTQFIQFPPIPVAAFRALHNPSIRCCVWAGLCWNPLLQALNCSGASNLFHSLIHSSCSSNFWSMGSFISSKLLLCFVWEAIKWTPNQHLHAFEPNPITESIHSQATGHFWPKTCT